MARLTYKEHLSREQFIQRFYEVLRKSYSQKQAYNIVEAEEVERFGKRKYKNYSSFHRALTHYLSEQPKC